MNAYKQTTPTPIVSNLYFIQINVQLPHPQDFDASSPTNEDDARRAHGGSNCTFWTFSKWYTFLEIGKKL